MQHDVDDEGPYREAVAYLLGKLSPEEGQEFEARYLEDQEAFEVLQAAEEDLIEEYLHGEGSPEERLLFEQHYVSRPGSLEKIEFAKELLHCASPEATPSSLPAPKPAPDRGSAERPAVLPFARPLAMAAAAALVLVIGVATWLAISVVRLNDRLGAAEKKRAELEARAEDLSSRLESEQDNNKALASELQQVQEQLKALQQSGAAPSVVSLFLRPELTRGGSPAREARLSQGVASLDLQLDVNDSGFALYRATVRQLSGPVILAAKNLKPAQGQSGKVLKIRLPAAALKPGRYVIILDGITDSGESRYAGEYSFTVVRQ